jgi:ATP-dependent helicase/nuclease subunit A
MTRSPVDAPTREQALDPTRSVLVQAPAGSGKTELLIQRYLKLLGAAGAPEEILAITFTRKAAAEMRSRVLDALSAAATGDEPEPAHLRTGYQLACRVVERDRDHRWGLLNQPSRLRIGTIDSVNAWLAAQAPLSAGNAALLEVTDDVAALYDEAARETVALVADSDALGAAVRRLLEHVDNRAEVLCRMLAEMLARRDQWLRHTGAGAGGQAEDTRRLLESSLARLVAEQLAACARQFNAELRARLLPIMRHAATSLAGSADADQDILRWADMAQFPGTEAEAAGAWRGLARTLLTGTGSLRKTVNKRQGFGTDNREMKDRCLELLAVLAQQPEIVAALARTARLPEPNYKDEQWQVLQALLSILPVAAAQLQQVFLRRGQADFGQVASDALAALGRADDPSELSLVMDYRLQHILMDEFQDTSRSQYDLLRAFTAGWTPGDGRSLFLVGDPMQSIYRFREAEVGLFLGLERHGLGDLPVEFLQLESNFRSDPAIIDWVNAVFRELLPSRPDTWLGAVPFHASRAELDANADAGVSWIAGPIDDEATEAESLAGLVDDLSRRYPAESIGILVRSRSHARSLLSELRRNGIAYAAPELEYLHEEPAVQDLLALTRALLHEGDRIAWLALLRSPCCGLTLADLHALAAGERESTVWQLLQSDAAMAGLSADGRHRAVRLRDGLAPWLRRRGACSLRELVQGCWLWIGGPATLDDAATLEATSAYFDFLDAQDSGGDVPDVAQLHLQLEGHAIRRGSSDARVQIMTMHKAKGLEFDSVLLPGLGRTTRVDTRPPLLWQALDDERSGSADLVLAPINASGDERDPLFELLWTDERKRAELERDRLLYVATTRARRRLFLFAGVRVDNDGNTIAPAAGSLLAGLWPHCADEVPTEQTATVSTVETAGPQWREVPLRRLIANWQAPAALAASPPDWPAARNGEVLEFDWAGRWTRQVGTVVHRWLQEFAERPGSRRDESTLDALAPVIERQLQRLGVGSRYLAPARDRVILALQACITDETGRWILSPEHQQSAAELAIAEIDGSGFRSLRVDRSFVSADGVRWIIDYKTGAHEGRDVDAFIASEIERYTQQLRDYRDAVRALDTERPIRTALYFPLLQRLAEVPLEDPSGEPMSGSE